SIFQQTFTQSRVIEQGTVVTKTTIPKEDTVKKASPFSMECAMTERSTSYDARTARLL
ncbi:hypothetical protein P7K49_028599, partial [Saguinus oedipus]